MTMMAMIVMIALIKMWLWDFFFHSHKSIPKSFDDRFWAEIFIVLLALAVVVKEVDVAVAIEGKDDENDEEEDDDEDNDRTLSLSSMLIPSLVSLKIVVLYRIDFSYLLWLSCFKGFCTIVTMVDIDPNWATASAIDEVIRINEMIKMRNKIPLKEW